jgi:8-oxo-dGTP diphosphatase
MSVLDRARSRALTLFGALPPRVRRGLVRAGMTTYTVGCVAVVLRGDEVLFLEQPHHRGLGLPGGLLARHETPAECVMREVREELGVELSVGGEPHAVVVDGRARRVDLIFVVRADDFEVARTSPEVHEVHWLPRSAVRPGTAAARAIEAALRAGHDR